MAETTVIGRSAFVRGRISGTGDLEIAGRVEGDVTCTGEVLVEASGLVAASIAARRVVVRGAVKGDLSADEAIVLEAGAKVVGDLRAPRIAIAQGGLVRGHVQTSAAGSPRKASIARPTVVDRPRPVAALAAPAAPPKAAPVKAAPPPPPVEKPKAPPPARESSRSVNGDSRAKAPPPRAAVTGRAGPPPPVVPVLKKGTKAVQKKRG